MTSHAKRLGRPAVLAIAAALTVPLVLAAETRAGPKKRRPLHHAEIQRMDTPYGSLSGSGHVVLPFSIADVSARRVKVQVEWGFDVDGDGIISMSNPGEPVEYFAATHARRDVRDTAKKPKGLVYSASPSGAGQAYAWDAAADVGARRFDSQGTLITTPQGRVIENPDVPGEPMRRYGETGVRLRMRAVAGRGANRLHGPWVHTECFSVDNNTAPTVGIDGVTPAGGVVNVQWSALDPDSEDADGDGEMDRFFREDANANGILDLEAVAVAFDFHRLEPGEDPSTLTAAGLDALLWLPCTRATGSGDTDSGVQVAQIQHPFTFAWNWTADPMTPDTAVILRARGWDGKEHGSTVYWLVPFTPAD